MRAFFNGWRRKVGFALLVMACAVFTMWMRSRVMLDVLQMQMLQRRCFITSCNNRVFWWTEDAQGKTGALRTSSFLLSPKAHDEESMTLPYVVDWNAKQCTIPYRSLALPLTLLSAYLILWKPRKKPKDRQDA